MTWRSKKQDMISRSSAEDEHIVMAHIVCQMRWLKNPMMKLGFKQPGPMPMHCDN